MELDAEVDRGPGMNPDKASSEPRFQPRPTEVPLMMETACRVEVSPKRRCEMLGRWYAVVWSSVWRRVWSR